MRNGDRRLLLSVRQIGPVHNEDLIGVADDGLVIDLHTDNPAGSEVDLGQDGTRYCTNTVTSLPLSLALIILDRWFSQRQPERTMGRLDLGSPPDGPFQPLHRLAHRLLA